MVDRAERFSALWRCYGWWRVIILTNAELKGYSDQLLSVKQDAIGLMSGLSDAQFNWQPAPGRWSMAGCFPHLNKSAARLFIPAIDGAIATARAKALRSDGPFAYSAWERWFIRNHDAPPKMQFKAFGSLVQMMLAHERRHVWQARGVRQQPKFAA